MSKRIPAIDWMRGIVMILMATDHASSAFNSGRPVTDSVLLYDPSVPLDAVQFFYRWLSHLCAPTFLFLAGTALALSIGGKMARGVGGGSMRATSVLVPPISKAIARSNPACRTTRAQPSTPPAGPLRSVSLAETASASTRPALLVMSCIRAWGMLRRSEPM